MIWIVSKYVYSVQSEWQLLVYHWKSWTQSRVWTRWLVCFVIYNENSWKPAWVGCLFVHFLSLVLFVMSELGCSAFLSSESCFDQMSDLLLSRSSLLKMRLFGRTCFSRGRLSESAPHPASPSAWRKRNVWLGAIESYLKNCVISTGRSEHKQLQRPQWPKTALLIAQKSSSY